eukprot:2458876-Amphidinium_carterae.1
MLSESGNHASSQPRLILRTTATWRNALGCHGQRRAGRSELRAGRSCTTRGDGGWHNPSLA